MKTSMNYFLALIALTLMTSVVVTAQADPLDGQVLKFQQLPMVNTKITTVTPPITGVYHGHDEESTLYGVPDAAAITLYTGTAMADDFADEFDTPVVHVRWWGSYLNNFTGTDARVDKFLIAFEDDVPASDTNPFSHPGDDIRAQIVNKVAVSPLLPGSGTYTEKLLFEAPGVETIYEYNAELHLDKQFPQKPGEIYWIKIAALVDQVPDGTNQLPRWGWHNRDYTKPDPFALAVTPVPVFPGERDERAEVPGGAAYPTPVWHFQDDAVSAFTQVEIMPNMPNMPSLVLQESYEPQNYLAPWDGPGPGIGSDGTTHGGIGLFSKDLAFELYTVPEPASALLTLIGLVGVLVTGRSRRLRA